MAKRTWIIGTTETDEELCPAWTDDELQAFEKYNLEPGVIQYDAGDLLVTERGAGANLSVDIAPGVALVEITNTNLSPSRTYNVYVGTDAIINKVLETADATHPRIDRVIAEVLVNTDPDATADNITSFRIVKGTAAASPSAPAEPDNCITLALINVPAGDTSITNSQITDSRPRSTYRTDVMKDIMRQGFGNSVAIAGGTADALTIPLDPPITAHTDKFVFLFRASLDNTGAMTLSPNGLTAKPFRKFRNTDMSANDVKAHTYYFAGYDSTDDDYKIIGVLGQEQGQWEVGDIKQNMRGTVSPGFLSMHGQSIDLTTYSALFAVCGFCGSGSGVITRGSNAAAFTADSGTDTLTSAGHGLDNNDLVTISNSGGALPTGLSATTAYYVVNKTTDTFQLSTSPGGSAENFSSNGTGTHSFQTTGVLPDARGRVFVTKDDQGGSEADIMDRSAARQMGGKFGTEKHTLTVDEMPAHSHNLSASVKVLGSAGATNPDINVTNDNGSDLTISSTGGDDPHENTQPSMTVFSEIKY